VRAAPPAPVDLVVRGTVVTIDRERTVVADGAVAVDEGVVVAVGRRSDIEAAFDAAHRLGGPADVVTPGFVNTHQHLTGDRLIRSTIPDDLRPGEPISAWALPSHGAHTPDDDEVSATLALAAAARNGITTTAEAGTVGHPDRVAAAFASVGVRGTLGTWGWDVGDGPFAAPAAEVLARQRANVAVLATHPLVDGWVTLVGHDLMTDELVVGASALARELSTGLTFHISPSGADATAYVERTGRRPLVHLAELGALGSHVLLAHAVHLDHAELDALVGSGAAVAYCPWAYLRLGQGVTRAGRHLEMVERGVRVGLGCDSENAGDAVDLLRVAALAAGLAKDTTADPTRFGAADALAMATIGGADALGMADRIGSIEVGKRADLVVHDTSGIHWQPRADDPSAELVWSSDGRSVRDVVVDGRVVVRDGRVATVDVRALADEATARRAALLRRMA
jgi:5-methylthioadenosine/S-adenosylhomocysteine deaminase